MDPWHSDDELFALARRELFPAVVGDVMDKLQLQHQFLPPRIKPLDDAMVVIGRAMPVLEADVYVESRATAENPLMAQPFGLMFRALDDLRPHEVYLCTGASARYALWGELMTLRALKLGAAGAVLDGYARDTHGVRRSGFPTFAHGGYAQDQGPRGKVIDFRVPVEIDGVRVDPGDIVFGDCDGVCIVPAQAAEETFRLALEKVRGEKRVQEALEAGVSAAEAFSTFGIM
ncbi:MAG TPA: RraA family protein [Chloroflexota bacterium]|nr:RraA family protein [Chloroflexota bacterium]